MYRNLLAAVDKTQDNDFILCLGMIDVNRLEQIVFLKHCGLIKAINHGDPIIVPLWNNLICH